VAISIWQTLQSRAYTNTTGRAAPAAAFRNRLPITKRFRRCRAVSVFSPEVYATIAKTSAGKTLVSRLFLVTKKSLLLTYDNQDGTFGYQIFDLDGRCRSPESVLDRYDIILAKDGMVYTVSQPAPRQDGTLPNPTIGVYLLRIKE